MIDSESIAHILLDVKAVQVRVNPPFTWTSGLLSPMYCDNRLLISYPRARGSVLDGFKKILEKNKLQFDVIAGTATAGIPWAAFLAGALNKPMVYVRPEPKEHGKGKQVEGAMEQGAKVLIVEDLISTGKSSLGSATACVREYKAQIVAVLAIFSYEMQKAKSAFIEAKIPYFVLSTFEDLLQVALKENYLSEEDKKSALMWNANPEAWHAAHAKSNE